jgi:hypothetical protein
MLAQINLSKESLRVAAYVGYASCARQGKFAYAVGASERDNRKPLERAGEKLR